MILKCNIWIFFDMVSKHMWRSTCGMCDVAGMYWPQFWSITPNILNTVLTRENSNNVSAYSGIHNGENGTNWGKTHPVSFPGNLPYYHVNSHCQISCTLIFLVQRLGHRLRFLTYRLRGFAFSHFRIPHWHPANARCYRAFSYDDSNAKVCSIESVALTPQWYWQIE